MRCLFKSNTFLYIFIGIHIYVLNIYICTYDDCIQWKLWNGMCGLLPHSTREQRKRLSLSHFSNKKFLLCFFSFDGEEYMLWMGTYIYAYVPCNLRKREKVRKNGNRKVTFYSKIYLHTAAPSSCSSVCTCACIKIYNPWEKGILHAINIFPFCILLLWNIVFTEIVPIYIVFIPSWRSLCFYTFYFCVSLFLYNITV